MYNSKVACHTTQFSPRLKNNLEGLPSPEVINNAYLRNASTP